MSNSYNSNPSFPRFLPRQKGSFSMTEKGPANRTQSTKNIIIHGVPKTSPNWMPRKKSRGWGKAVKCFQMIYHRMVVLFYGRKSAERHIPPPRPRFPLINMIISQDGSATRRGLTLNQSAKWGCSDNDNNGLGSNQSQGTHLICMRLGLDLNRYLPSTHLLISFPRNWTVGIGIIFAQQFNGILSNKSPLWCIVDILEIIHIIFNVHIHLDDLYSQYFGHIENNKWRRYEELIPVICLVSVKSHPLRWLTPFPK